MSSAEQGRYSVKTLYHVKSMLGDSYLWKKKESLLDHFVVLLSVCLSVLSSFSLYLRYAWRYRVEIQTIYSDLRSMISWKYVFLHLLKKRYSRLYHKKNITRISTLWRESKLIGYFRLILSVVLVQEKI